MDGEEHQGTATAHRTGVTVEGGRRRAGGVSQGSISGSCCVCLGVGGWWVIDMDKGLIVEKALKKKRERGGNATKSTGTETSKSPRLVGIQHQGAPRRPREQRGALGEGRGAKGRPPSPAD